MYSTALAAPRCPLQVVGELAHPRSIELVRNQGWEPPGRCVYPQANLLTVIAAFCFPSGVDVYFLEFS